MLPEPRLAVATPGSAPAIFFNSAAVEGDDVRPVVVVSR
jgi:hypothetical protein